MHSNDGVDAPGPLDTLAQGPMRARQILAITMCVLINALDGFDVLSISFASPGIAAEWAINKAMLGIVMSMEMIGMAAGALLLGQVADRIGRTRVVFSCLALMMFGMGATMHAPDVMTLAMLRGITGIAIGGMLASLSALVAEYSNDHWRHSCVAIVAAGYPMGAILGGSIAGPMLAMGNWRDIFLLGASVSLVLLPLAMLLLPESIEGLLRQRPSDALARVNRSLRRLGHEARESLPPVTAQTAKPSALALFAPPLRRVSILLTLAYFLHFMAFYFLLKWVPKIVVDMGFSPALASNALVWANVGGLLGGLGFSLLCLRLPLRGLLTGAFLLSMVMMLWFGRERTELASLNWVIAATGFFTNAGVIGLFSLVVASFPTTLRASGTGLVIGIGRGGAALGPILAGFLFQWGFSLPLVATVMAAGSLLAALAVLALPDPRGPLPQATTAPQDHRRG